MIVVISIVQFVQTKQYNIKSAIKFVLATAI